jgi:hypothetical protein
VFEIFNFKKGATGIKLNTAVTNLNVLRISVSHCGRDKNMEYIPLNWLLYWLLRSELLSGLRAGQIHKF